MTPSPRPFGGALQVAVGALARDALAVGVKGTLPTNQHYLDTQGIGAGTLQRALDELRARRALKTQSRGHLGRVVTFVDVAAAWHTGNLAPLRLVLPPAGPVEIAALQLLLAQALSKLGIPHAVDHVRGGSIRLAQLGESADLAVFSTGVLSDLAGPAGLLVRRLGVGSYYAPGRLVVVRRQGDGAPPRRIGIDRDSVDHRILTLGEFPESGGFEYVQRPFTRLPAAVLVDEADAAIWHIAPSVVPLDRAGLVLEPMATPGGLAAWEATSEAVLAASPLRPELKAVLPALDLRDLASLQATAIAEDTGLLPIA
jgi:hypothetical protein